MIRSEICQIGQPMLTIGDDRLLSIFEQPSTGLSRGLCISKQPIRTTKSTNHTQLNVMPLPLCTLCVNAMLIWSCTMILGGPQPAGSPKHGVRSGIVHRKPGLGLPRIVSATGSIHPTPFLSCFGRCGAGGRGVSRFIFRFLVRDEDNSKAKYSE